MTINVEDIVYLHCHQQENDGTVVLVGQDGVQRSPIHFPKGGHLLAFLTCLENGLMPNGSLDPPLLLEPGKGKVFPRLRRSFHNRKKKEEKEESSSESEPEAMDYVFRIISSFEKLESICK